VINILLFITLSVIRPWKKRDICINILLNNYIELA
jgi:hypothetical protein